MMKSFRPLILGLSACLLASSGCRRSQEIPTQPEIAVHVITATAKPVADKIVASGSIEAVTKAEVAFLVAGRTLSVEVEDGAVVKKDQVLARLDSSDYQQAAAIAEARLSEITSRHERLSRLRELGSLTATDFDKIEAGLREATSAAELARRQLAYTELRAPFDGIVTKHGIASGVVVAPGIPVFTVQAPAPVRVSASVADSDARRVAIGQNVEIHVPAVGKQVYIGKVEALLPQADPLSRSFSVKIRIEGDDAALRPGSVAIAHIQTGRSHEAICLPPQVVQKFADGSLYVWLVDPAKKTAVRQLIEAGSLQSDEVEISAGLKAGDLVIAQVPHTIFEGTPLKVSAQP